MHFQSKDSETLSANNDILSKLLKKQNECICTAKPTKAFNKLKEGIIKVSCLAHYNAPSEKNHNRRQYKRVQSNNVAKAKNWKIKTDRICEEIFIRYRKKNAMIELEFLAAV